MAHLHVSWTNWETIIFSFGAQQVLSAAYRRVLTSTGGIQAREESRLGKCYNFRVDDSGHTFVYCKGKQQMSAFAFPLMRN